MLCSISDTKNAFLFRALTVKLSPMYEWNSKTDRKDSFYLVKWIVQDKK